jgi:rod shape-determining protein MreD
VTKDATLLIAFALGIIIDIFAGTPGFNAFATVSVAYVKPFFQKAFGPREEHDFIIPSFRTYGTGMFLQYSASLVLIHHSLFFIVESASLFRIEDVILKTICCAIFTMLIVVSMEFFKARRR